MPKASKETASEPAGLVNDRLAGASSADPTDTGMTGDSSGLG